MALVVVVVLVCPHHQAFQAFAEAVHNTGLDLVGLRLVYLSDGDATSLVPPALERPLSTPTSTANASSNDHLRRVVVAAVRGVAAVVRCVLSVFVDIV